MQKLNFDAFTQQLYLLAFLDQPRKCNNLSYTYSTLSDMNGVTVTQTGQLVQQPNIDKLSHQGLFIDPVCMEEGGPDGVACQTQAGRRGKDRMAEDPNSLLKCIPCFLSKARWHYSSDSGYYSAINKTLMYYVL